VGCADAYLPAVYPPWHVALATALLSTHLLVLAGTAVLWLVAARFTAQRDGALMLIMFCAALLSITLPVAELLGPQRSSCLGVSLVMYMEKLAFIPAYLVRILRVTTVHLQQARLLRTMADTPTSGTGTGTGTSTTKQAWAAGGDGDGSGTPSATAPYAPPSPLGFTPSLSTFSMTPPPRRGAPSHLTLTPFPPPSPTPLPLVSPSPTPTTLAADVKQQSWHGRVLAVWERWLERWLVQYLQLHVMRRAWLLLAVVQVMTVAGIAASLARDPRMRPGKVGCNLFGDDQIVVIPLSIVFVVVVALCLPTIVTRRDAFYLREEYIVIFALGLVFGPLAMYSLHHRPDSPLRTVAHFRRVAMFFAWAHCFAAYWLPAITALHSARRRHATVAPAGCLPMNSEALDSGSRVLTAGGATPTSPPSALRAVGSSTRRYSDADRRLPQAALLFMVSTTSIVIGTTPLAALPWQALMTVCSHVVTAPLGILDARDIRLVAALLAGTPLRDSWLRPLLQREMVSEQLLFLQDCLALRTTASRLVAAIAVVLHAPAGGATLATPRRLSGGVTAATHATTYGAAALDFHHTDAAAAAATTMVTESGGGMMVDAGGGASLRSSSVGISMMAGSGSSAGGGAGGSSSGGGGGVNGVGVSVGVELVGAATDVVVPTLADAAATAATAAVVIPVVTTPRVGAAGGTGTAGGSGSSGSSSSEAGHAEAAPPVVVAGSLAVDVDSAGAPPATVTGSALPLTPAAAASRKYLLLSLSALTASIQRLEARYLVSFSPQQLSLSRATAGTTARRLRAGKEHLIALSCAVRAYNLEWLRTSATAVINETGRAFDAAAHETLCSIAAGPVCRLLYSPEGPACMADLADTLRRDPYRARPGAGGTGGADPAVAASQVTDVGTEQPAWRAPVRPPIIAEDAPAEEGAGSASITILPRLIDIIPPLAITTAV